MYDCSAQATPILGKSFPARNKLPMKIFVNIFLRSKLRGPLNVTIQKISYVGEKKKSFCKEMNCPNEKNSSFGKTSFLI